MATYPSYTFDSSTNYAQVRETVMVMLSDLINQYGCCKPKYVEEAINEALPFIQCFDYDEATNTERYKSDVETSYKLLFNIANG